MSDRDSDFSFDKFANAVVFLLRECKEQLGLTVLLKLLFRADFRYYERYLRSITGVQYAALERGPVPNNYRELVTRLVARGYVDRVMTDMGPGMKHRQDLRPLREPNLDAFSVAELEVLREIAKTEGCKTGAQLSAETHEELPWRCVYQGGDGDGETIPYSLARWEANRCSPADLAAAVEDLRDPEVQKFLSEFLGDSRASA
jgi:hypothetical protein